MKITLQLSETMHGTMLETATFTPVLKLNKNMQFKKKRLSCTDLFEYV